MNKLFYFLSLVCIFIILNKFFVYLKNTFYFFYHINKTNDKCLGGTLQGVCEET